MKILRPTALLFTFLSLTAFGQSPFITQQPVSLSVTQGQTAEFFATISGSQPLNLQWSFNGTNIPAATLSNYVVVTAHNSDAGYYRVTAANSLGTVSSVSALLTVLPPPQSYTNSLPTGVSLIANQLDHGSNTLNEIMPVVPEGSVLYKYNNSGSNWTASAYSRAGGWINGDTLTLNPGEGAFFQSPTNFDLTFTGTPHVPVLPVTVPAGAVYLLSRQTNDFADVTNVLGVVPAAGTRVYLWNGADYQVYMLRGGIGWSPSDPPEVPVGGALWVSTQASPPAIATAPLITQQPVSLTVTQGGAAVFSVSAIGAGTLTYQWSHDSITVTNGTNAVLTIADAQSSDEGAYVVAVTNGSGKTSSEKATLTLTLSTNCCDNKNWYHWVTYNNSTPPARSDYAMTYHNDPSHQRVVLYGGLDNTGSPLYDLWEWTGLHWVNSTPSELQPGGNGVHPKYSPQPRAGHAMAFLPSGNPTSANVTMMFGGQNTLESLADTWVWNGAKWLNQTPGVAPGITGSSPTARFHHAMAYDGVNGKIILFGGNDGAIRDDTWLWDGKQWAQQSPVHSPPARQGHAMAYDSAKHVVVLFGGDNGGLMNDTWEWNGVDWSPAPPTYTFPPAGRRNFGMAYESDCGRIVIFGGETPGPNGDTFERDETTKEWTQLTRALAPSARGQLAGAFIDVTPNTSFHEFLIYGGTDGTAQDDTWSWGFRRLNDGPFRTDVLEEGNQADMWTRELATRRFSWHKIGTFLNHNTANHYLDNIKAYTSEDPADTTITTPSTATYSQKRGKNRCNDDFTDCIGCTSGCIPDNSVCHWSAYSLTFFQDYALNGNFCNAGVAAFIDFKSQRSWVSDKLVGQLSADGGNSSYFVSPAAPLSGADAQVCRQDRYDTESASTSYKLINTIKNKEARVDTQWTVSRVGCGISTGLNPTGPQCTGGGAGGSNALPCSIQYFEYSQIQGQLHFKFSTLAPAFSGANTFCFYIDADNDSNTGGAANSPECGADYRICISPNNSTAVVEKYDACLNPPWQPTSYQIYNTHWGQTVMSFSVLLSAVGAPQGVYSAWMASYDNGVLCDSKPEAPCTSRMQLNCVNADTNCPRVNSVDTVQVTSLQNLTAPVNVLLSEPMQPFADSDVTVSTGGSFLVPGVDFRVSQDQNSQSILSITPVTRWAPGAYFVTVNPTIKDLAGNALDGNADGVCGDPFNFDFCVTDPNFYVTDLAGSYQTQFSFGSSVYAKGTGFQGVSSVTLYVVLPNAVDAFGTKLADWTAGGPHTVSPNSVSGVLSPANLGTLLVAENFKIVADMNGNGIYDAGDRVTDLCGPGFTYGTPCESTIDDIVAWWPFEDSGATSAELMAGNNGTFMGGTPPSVAGMVGKARDFTGGIYLDVPDDTTSEDPELNMGTGDFSIETWIRTTNASGEMPIVDKRSSDASFTGYYLRLVNGQLSFLMGAAGGGTATYGGAGVNAADGQWHNVGVAVARNRAVNLYVDGVAQSTGSPLIGSVDNEDNLRIGGNRAVDPQIYFTGVIDELEMYDRALLPEEMLYIFTQHGAGKCVDAVAPTATVAGGTNQVWTTGVLRFISTVVSPYPVDYQWWFNGVPLTNSIFISGATNAVLTISNATIANAGHYYLTVNNFAGGFTTPTILVNIVLPEALAITRQSNQITLNWSNSLYHVQSASTLGPSGSPVWTNVPGNSPLQLPAGSQKFFRLVYP
jgi:hypothetical protein